MSYLEQTSNVWQNPYPSANVESHTFRAYGRFFKDRLQSLTKARPKVLDFGCGEGAALSYFSDQGLDVYGVDVSESSISVCQEKLPNCSDHFKVIPPAPNLDDDFFGCKFDFVVSMQVLYYMNRTDLKTRLENLYGQMNDGAYFYASMVGKQCYWYENSTPAEGGARLVKFEKDRYKMDPHCMLFMEGKEDLLETFSMFKKVHVGYYDAVYLENEGSEYHYTFIGQK